jgi:hypothetical protein
MWRHVVWQKLNDILELLTASLIALMMEAVSMSETSVGFTGLQGATSQKTVIILSSTILLFPGICTAEIESNKRVTSGGLVFQN